MSSHYSDLIEAILDEDPEKVKLLLKQGVDLTLTDMYQKTPLIIAMEVLGKILKEQVEKNKKYFQYNQYIEEENEKETAAIDSIIEAILAHQDIQKIIDIAPFMGMTPLSYALDLHDHGLVKRLLAKGANPFVFISENSDVNAIETAKLLGSFDSLREAFESREQQMQKEEPEKYQAMKEFDTLLQFITYDVGHMLGVGIKKYNVLTQPYTDRKVTLETEGGFELNALSKLMDVIQSFLKKIKTRLSSSQPPSKPIKVGPKEDEHHDYELKVSQEDVQVQALHQDLQAINQAFKEGLELITHEDEDTLPGLILRLNQQLEGFKKQKDEPKLTYIPSGWSSHAISIAVYGELLIVTNRGQGMEETGTTIYKLKDNCVFTEDNLKPLLFNPEGQMWVVKPYIQKLVDPNFAGISLGSSAQMRGTCSWSNTKSCIEGELFAQRFYRLPLEQQKTLYEAMKIGPFHIAPENDRYDYIYELRKEPSLQAQKRLADIPAFQAIAEASVKAYKKLTKFMRDESIVQLKQRYEQAKKEASQKKESQQNLEIYRILIAGYLLEHHGVKKKKKQRGDLPKPLAEIERAEQLLTLFSVDELSGLKNNIQQLSNQSQDKYFSSKAIANVTLQAAINKGAFKYLRLLEVDILSKEFFPATLEYVEKAIRTGDQETLKNLFEMYPKVIEHMIEHEKKHIKTNGKRIKHPLHLAIVYNQPEVFKLILKHGGSLADQDEFNASIFSQAIAYGRAESFGLLEAPGIAKLINQADSFKQVPLSYALAHDIQLCDKLIAKGAKLNRLPELKDPLQKARLLILGIHLNKQELINKVLKDKDLTRILNSQLMIGDTSQTVYDYAITRIKDKKSLRVLQSSAEKTISPLYDKHMKLYGISEKELSFTPSPTLGKQKKKT